MQKRHENRNIYFKELSITSRNYFIPYIECWHPVEAKMDVLEIGCGEGGNLLPFSEIGCNTVGVDLAESRIKDAKTFFNESHTKGEFIASDIFNLKKLEQSFDIIICHDIFEHITEKELFLFEQISKTTRYCFYVIPSMANAIWRSSTNMPKPNFVPSTFYSFIPHFHIPITSENL